MVVAASNHIVLDERGVAWIANTAVKVLEVVRDKLAYGFSVEEIHVQHSHLSLAQIHAALAYYYDHQDEIDGQLSDAETCADQIRSASGGSPVRDKLRALGRIP